MLCGKRKPLALARCTHVQYSVLVQVGVHNTVSSFLEMHGFVIISRNSPYTLFFCCSTNLGAWREVEMSSMVRTEPVATVLHLDVALRIVRPDSSRSNT